MSAIKDEVYGVRLPKRMCVALDAAAERRGGIGRANVVRIALAEFLKREEDEQPSAPPRGERGRKR